MIAVQGKWNEGFVFDEYIKHSEMLGFDAFGKPHFANEYSPIGKLLHSMKYNGHFNTSDEIAEMCSPAIGAWIKDKHVNVILPVPPTMERVFQPVKAVSERVAEILNIYFSDEVLHNKGTHPIKNVPKEERDMRGIIVQNKPAKRECNILLFDDLYSSGETANECVRVLRQDPLIKNIYYFAIAKTK